MMKKNKIKKIREVPFFYGTQINGVAVSPDGKTLCLVGDEITQLVDSATGRLLRHLESNYIFSHDCAFSPDGEKIAIAHHGIHTEIFDSTTGEQLHDLITDGGVPNATLSLAWSSDSKLIVSAGESNSLSCWNAQTGEKQWTHKGHSKSGVYYNVVFLPDNNILASYGLDQEGYDEPININNVLEKICTVTGKVETTIEVDTLIKSIALGKGGKIAMAGEDDDIYILNSVLNIPLKIDQKLKQSQVTDLVWNDDDLWACDESGSLKCWGSDGSKKTILKDNPSFRNLEAYENRLWCVGDSGNVHVVIDQILKTPSKKGHTDRIRNMLASPEIGVLSIDDDDNVMFYSKLQQAHYIGEFYDISLEKFQAEFIENIFPNLTRHSLNAFLNYSEVLCPISENEYLQGDDDGNLSYFVDNTLEWEKNIHDEEILDIKLSTNKKKLLIAGQGTNAADAWVTYIRVYSWPQMKQLKRIRNDDFGAFNRMSFSPNESLLCLPSDTAIFIYDMRNFKKIKTVDLEKKLNGDDITCSAFFDDQKIIFGTDNGAMFYLEL